MNNVGLNVVEGVANGGATFKDPSKRNIGLLGQFGRGIPYQPALIRSMEEFNTIFGGLNPLYYGPQIVKSLFDEAGDTPVTLYCARAIGSDSVVASRVATYDTNKTMTVKAGYKGMEDPGIWGNSLKVVLYSYGYKAKDSFVLEVKLNNVVVETFTGETLAEIQNKVSRVSKYITVNFSAEMTKGTLAALTGTATTLTTSKEVTGVGTNFLTELFVGTPIYTNGETPVYIGTVASIVSDLKVILTGNAFSAVAGAAIKKRDDKTIEATLESGSEGTTVEADFYAVDGVTPKGLACFREYDIQILASTEFHTLTMAKKLRDFVQEVKVPLGIVNLPLNADESTAELYALDLQTADISYLTGIFGWVKVQDVSGNYLTIPALGAVLGAAYLRTPFMNGDYVHIPPGGTDSVFNYVLETVPNRLAQPVINRIVRDFTCNVIRYDEAIGFYVGSSRTYSKNPLYQSVHIRQQTTYYRRYLGIKMKYLEQRANTPELKSKGMADLRSFFKTEYDNGALERSVPFEKAFRAVSDISNNPLGQDRKVLNFDVYYIPTECTEEVKISLLRNDGELTVKE